MNFFLSIFLILGMLFPSLSRAGRESHGVLPIGYECRSKADSKTQIRVRFEMNQRRIVRAVYTDGQRQALSFPCNDTWPTHGAGAKLESSVTCRLPQKREILLELKESRNRAEMIVWDLRNQPEARRIDTLDCL